MKTSDIDDELFLKAVNALDAGDIAGLKQLIAEDPSLVKECLHTPEVKGYFNNPYLLWFVADNPIRNSILPANIVEVTQFLIDTVKQHAPETAQLQLNYALELVTTGRTPSESGVQIALMDVLINAGAKASGALAALTNGNIEAAEHLISRGDKLTLAVAVGLKRVDDVEILLLSAAPKEKLTALTVAAFYGMADMTAFLLEKGVDPNGYPNEGDFHGHGTPLHQAVSSGSLATVRLLAEAAADLTAIDKIYKGTPLEWADYMQRDEETTDAMRMKYKVIADYLKSLGS